MVHRSSSSSLTRLHEPQDPSVSSVRTVPKQRPHSRSRTMERKRCVTQDNYWGDRRTRMRPRLSARDEPRRKVCSKSWCRELPPKQLSDSHLAPRADNTGLDSHGAAKRENTCRCSQAFLLAFLGPWRGQRRWVQAGPLPVQTKLTLIPGCTAWFPSVSYYFTVSNDI